MTDDADRLSVLSDMNEKSKSEDSSDANPEPEPEADQEPKPDPEPDPEPEPSRDGTGSESGSTDDPAFAYADAKQGPIYARPETWEKFERTLTLDAESLLWDEDVQNIHKRELHDAGLRLIAKNPERLVELALEARRERK